jgi:chemotaxis signal transduction protein
MKSALPLGERAAQLRDLFDQSFRSAPAESVLPTEDFLLIRVADLPYAMRVSQVSAVAAHRRVVPVPSRRADLLGLAGIRGGLVCVFDLATLLGHAPGSAANWLAMCGDTEPVGLAFEELEVFARAARADVHDDAPGAKGLVGGVVRTGPIARPIVDLDAIAEVIRGRAGAAGDTRSPP